MAMGKTATKPSFESSRNHFPGSMTSRPTILGRKVLFGLEVAKTGRRPAKNKVLEASEAHCVRNLESLPTISDGKVFFWLRSGQGRAQIS